MKFSIPLLFCSFLLAACTSAPTEVQDAPIETDQPRKTAVRETKNVLYSGVVRPAGISIFQEGTHRLSLNDGKFILLESETVDINAHLGEEVEVFGNLRPTVEAGGMIMDVKKITSMEEVEPVVEEPLEEQDEQVENVADEPAEDVVEDVIEDSNESSDSEESKEEVESEEPEEVIEPTVEEEDVSVSTVDEDKITRMAKNDFAPDNWKYSYCSSHVGFCVPVHKNWWYKSFGATTSSLWHIEIGPDTVELMGDNPLVIDLLTGKLSSISKTDGDVVEDNDTVTGYRQWTKDRYFTIKAHKSLAEPVEYMTSKLSEFIEEETTE